MKIYVRFEWEGKTNLIKILNEITDEQKDQLIWQVEKQYWAK